MKEPVSPFPASPTKQNKVKGTFPSSGRKLSVMSQAGTLPCLLLPTPAFFYPLLTRRKCVKYDLTFGLSYGKISLLPVRSASG